MNRQVAGVKRGATRTESSSGKEADVRGLALRALNKVFGRSAYTDHITESTLQKSALSLGDKRLFTQLVNGTVKTRITIDAVLEMHVDGPLRKLRPTMLNILRLGAYQLLFLDKVPAYAAIDEAVEQAKRIFDVSVAGFINAVLRKVTPTDIKVAASGKPQAEAISTELSFPVALVADLLSEFSSLPEPDVYVRSLLSFFNEPAPTFLRVNRKVTDMGQAIHALGSEGITAVSSLILPEDVLLIEGGGAVASTKAFREGLVHIQSAGSALSPVLLAPKKDQVVIDMCAAPGGKTTHLAGMVGDNGLVIAVDINEKRLALLQENSQRLSTLNIASVCADATALSKVIKEPVDHILLDAPCSGLGSMGRKADLRYGYDKARVVELASLQGKLLREATRLVKKGGTILYSVCTFTEEETSGVINELLADDHKFKLDGEIKRALAPAELIPTYSHEGSADLMMHWERDGCFYLDPVIFHTDAFYYAKLRKVA